MATVQELEALQAQIDTKCAGIILKEQDLDVDYADKAALMNQHEECLWEWLGFGSGYFLTENSLRSDVQPKTLTEKQISEANVRIVEDFTPSKVPFVMQAFGEIIKKINT